MEVLIGILGGVILAILIIPALILSIIVLCALAALLSGPSTTKKEDYDFNYKGCELLIESHKNDIKYLRGYKDRVRTKLEEDRITYDQAYALMEKIINYEYAGCHHRPANMDQMITKELNK